MKMGRAIPLFALKSLTSACSSRDYHGPDRMLFKQNVIRQASAKSSSAHRVKVMQHLRVKCQSGTQSIGRPLRRIILPTGNAEL
jgi:hypothetical protein